MTRWKRQWQMLLMHLHTLQILAKALPVGAAYAHAVIFRRRTGQYDVLAWHSLSGSMETGLSEPMPSMDNWDKHEEWTKNVKVDLEQAS